MLPRWVEQFQFHEGRPPSETPARTVHLGAGEGAPCDHMACHFQTRAYSVLFACGRGPQAAASLIKAKTQQSGVALARQFK